MKPTHTKDCKELLKNLNDYIDGELEGMLCAEIDAHLEHCNNCQIVVNTLKKTIHLYQEEGQEVQIPDEVRRRLLARLDLER